MPIKVFISSTQNEFKKERKFIKEELEKDPSFSNYFEFFVFEEDPAQPISPKELYINEVMDSEIYIGLLGFSYGDIKDNGLSATELEYDIYNTSKHEAYFFVKNVDKREKKVEEFIEKISHSKVFKYFDTTEELIYEIKISLENYIIKKSSSNMDFDKRIIYDSSYEDIDDEAYGLFFDVLDDKNILKLKDKRSPESILATIDAGDFDYNNNFHLNNAGILFFAKDVSKFNKGHKIKMVRFNGVSRLEVIDKLYSGSSFFILLKEFENFFMKNIKMGYIIENWKRIAIPEYPIEAVREALINAIAHRDYNLDEDIHFYIYDDRIEIISPGKLKYPLTLKELDSIDHPVHRNRRICDIFYKTVYMETLASGILRMKKAMKDSGLPTPEFSEGSNFFKVVFRGPNGQLIPNNGEIKEEYVEDLSYLNDRQISAFAMMTNDNIKFYYSTYAKKFNVSEATAKRDLKELVKLDLIKQTSIKRKNCFFV